MSYLHLQFADTNQDIGHVEFDLGHYTNKVREQLVKTILDLKSDKFPGCQIYIYVNIQLIDKLPEKASNTASGPNASFSSASTARQSIASLMSDALKVDVNANKNQILKEELQNKL